MYLMNVVKYVINDVEHELENRKNGYNVLFNT